MRPVEPGGPGRVPASEVPGITGLSFLPSGAEGTLVNISTTGLLAESATRLSVGSPLEVVFAGRFSPRSVKGRVARCQVATMGRDGRLHYHLAIEFDAPIVLASASSEPASPPPSPASAPPSKEVRNRW